MTTASMVGEGQYTYEMHTDWAKVPEGQRRRSDQRLVAPLLDNGLDVETIAIILFSVLFSVLIAVPLGIMGARSIDILTIIIT